MRSREEVARGQRQGRGERIPDVDDGDSKPKTGYYIEGDVIKHRTPGGRVVDVERVRSR